MMAVRNALGLAAFAVIRADDVAELYVICQDPMGANLLLIAFAPSFVGQGVAESTVVFRVGSFFCSPSSRRF